MTGRPWRPVLGLIAGTALLVGWWFREPSGSGWQSGLSVLLVLTGTGLVGDSLRDLLRTRKHTG
ncbi:hypothetical protein [Actinoplanes couchii]|uniref:hypothetical protein n=1 Tax=Actinoplanes couchii TaxID=403638 RepID=UPI0019442693|nr:hypothetical protein [Actinoplanes couchii]MDR6320922.1 hypothetical protein [Actinoplanes couchii]